VRSTLAVISVALFAVIAGSAAFASITLYNQVQHDNDCATYRNALLATTSTPGAVPSLASDYAILSSTDRAEIQADVRSYAKHLRSGIPQDQLLEAFHDYMASYVPHALAAQGC
jgi:hypothetical protein